MVIIRAASVTWFVPAAPMADLDAYISAIENVSC